MRGAAWCVLSLLACGEARWLPPPPVSGELAVVSTRSTGATLLERTPQLPKVAEIDPEQPVWALGYSRALEELQLAPAPVLLHPPGEGRRPLPRPVDLYVADLEAGRWSVGDPSLAERWAVPELDFPRCLEEGLCLDNLPSCTACRAAAPPTPPTLPTPPCPAGWTVARRYAPFQLCAPNVPGRVACAPSEWQPVASASCLALDRCDTPLPSPQGPLPPLFVSAGAVGGDGSPGRPYGTLNEALAGRTTPHQVLLGAGRYDEALTLEADGWILRGVCPEGVFLDRPVVVTASVTLASLSLEGRGSLASALGARLELRSVRVGPGEGPGITVRGQLVADGLIVEGRVGVGLLVESSGSVALQRAEIRGASAAQIEVEGGLLVGADLRLVGGDGGPGCQRAGLLAHHGARVELRRLVSERHCDSGVRAFDPGTRVLLLDALLRDHPAAGEGQGYGLTAFGGAQAILRRVGITHTRKNGLGVVDGELDAEDLWLTDTVANDPYAFGVWIGENAKVSLRRVVLADNEQADVGTVATSSVSLVDVLILPKAPDHNSRISTDRLVVERLFVGPAERTYLSGQASLALSDLTMATGDLEIPYFPNLRVSRVQAGPGTEVALRIVARACGVHCEPMILEDLTLRALGEQVIGLDIESVLTTRVERFSISGGDPALRARDGELELLDGQFDDAPLGIVLPGPPKDPARVLGSVHFGTVVEPLRYEPID